MYLIKTPIITDPKINLAIEEYAVRNLDISNDYLFIYSNSPSVIIGKNQNPFEEINISFLNENSIELVRRISGGGAVYHEKGNINFSYITKSTKENFNNYSNFLQPIASLLNDLNVPAKINHRNDLLIGEKKISGNAQFTSRRRMLCHGTLLFDADLKKLSSSLKVSSKNLESKSTKSVKSKVTNISNFLPEPCNISDFKKRLLDGILCSFSFEGYLEFDQIQWNEINVLAKDKYSTWNWNWGRTPKFQITVLETTLKFKTIITVERGHISKLEYLDSDESLKEITSCLQNTRYTKSSIIKQLELNNQNLSKQIVQRLVKALFPF